MDAREGFRYAMSPRWRIGRSVGFSVVGLALLGMALGAPDAVGAILALVVVAWCARALRIVLGPAVVVADESLVVIRTWPRRRRVRWERVADVEVVPGSWVLRLDLDDGEVLELPPVERLDDLYERVQERRGRAGGDTGINGCPGG